ncbi:peptidylprolyl isomerase [Advenella mimigardefordensis]|uniref:peptidylprolyl isomerase n=1 Tax=Advenella mimigardefordensis (strain DSM 17166 / LMG 22922 / DPN7) TaxID=1247726 RepID=W0PCM6_ADVMD|nr:peptidylprolyl isomerase [Advenella mimigardefordensis]AHG64501.1 putative parvulin-type peptidyl-prolyl cis-trans isomerase [Advenella mimigardefordensis DPN7]
MKRFILLAVTCAMTVPALAQNVATVNGKAITSDQVDTAVKTLVARGATDSPALREQITEQLINSAVLSQEAEKQGVDKNPEVQFAIENARQEIMIGSMMRDWAKTHPVSDEAIKKAYDDFKAQSAGEQEYQVKHILVKDETAANKLLKDIKAKKISFADAAKKNSIDPGSGKNGGDLGWAPAENYVPEFAEAVKAAKKGQLLDKPVKSQFGWHIIQVTDSRPVKVPTLEEAKPQISQMLSQQSLQEQMKKLRDEAKIEKTPAEGAADKPAEQPAAAPATEAPKQ